MPKKKLEKININGKSLHLQMKGISNKRIRNYNVTKIGKFNKNV